MLQRSLLRAANRTVVSSAARVVLPTVRHQSNGELTVLDKSLWHSIVPKPLRKENRHLLKNKTRQWNPATFFIIIFLLIGSMSIQMIALRNSFTRYMRQSEMRIGVLKEVVEKIQRGEEVDVEKALGTGDPQKEADWEEILKQIEKDDKSNRPKKSRGRKKSAQKDEEEAAITQKVVEQAAQPEAATVQATSRGTSSFGNFF